MSTNFRRFACLGTALCALALSIGPAAQAASGPRWRILSQSVPTNFPPASSGARYLLTVENVGSTAEGGIVIEDLLPPNFTATAVKGKDLGSPVSLSNELICNFTPTVSCVDPEPAPTGDFFTVIVTVNVSPAAGATETNLARVSGGGASASVEDATMVSPTPAPFGLQSNTFHFDAVNEDRSESNIAGSHPFELTTELAFNTAAPNANDNISSEHGPKDIDVTLPPGLIGNPQAVPRCQAGSAAIQGYLRSCPLASQVGVADVLVGGPGVPLTTAGGPFAQEAPIYNLVPSTNSVTAEFGFEVETYPVLLTATVNADGTVSTDLHNASQTVPILNTSISFWGVPADPAHDLRRFGTNGSVPPNPSSESPSPFLDNPTACGAPLSTLLQVDQWLEPGIFHSYRSTSVGAITGCNALSFTPSLSIAPDSNQADQPAGYAVDLEIPQHEGPTQLSTPALRDATVTLPKGVTVSASQGDGLAACTQAQVGLGSTTPANCPPAAKIATVKVETPVLAKPLDGQVYLGTPACAPCSASDAQSGRLIHLYLEIQGPGIDLKLPGSGALDPQSGQITATFLENPQLPFSRLQLNFKSGPRAALANPSVCGTYRTTSALTPWSAPETSVANPTSTFPISAGANGAPCASSEAAQPNQPSFEAGTTIPIAGSYSPFVLKLGREDGSQRLASIDTTLPKGLVGKLAGIPYCSEAAIAAARTSAGEAQLASPSCPPASEVGTVDVAAGPGSAPFHVSGHAYLSGPYKGAPLSLAIITPAVAGPFDLGTVVVRAALYVNPLTTQIHAVSDPIPAILAGIPLDVRSIALNMNRPDFTLNPTSCNPMAVLGSATSTLGSVAPLSDRFQVGACNALGFKPSLALNLKGGTRRHTFPALKATLTYPKKGAYANIAKAQVTLPHSEFLEQGHIGTVCTRVQFAAKACPKASIYGKARAISPLLDKPVSGPVYLRSSSNKLPDLVAELNGQIDVVLDGKIDTGKGGGIRNTFQAVPDAPISKFVLELKGGMKGLLVNSENICSKNAKTTAIADFTAQNGKVHNTTPTVTNSCGKKKRSSKRVSTSYRLAFPLAF
ncbi:MAG: hypothetical protein H0X42_09600 [Solirubrobacterales bacterium]|nr:hypothetical protein [Solirubrobacterales bacterium]